MSGPQQCFLISIHFIQTPYHDQTETEVKQLSVVFEDALDETVSNDRSNGERNCVT